MWEAGNALATISAAAEAARCNSAMVVLTAGDAGVVQRHTQEFWQMINAGIDMLFCNKYVTSKNHKPLHIVLCAVCAFSCAACTVPSLPVHFGRVEQQAHGSWRCMLIVCAASCVSLLPCHALPKF